MELQTNQIKLKMNVEAISAQPKLVPGVLPVHTMQKHLCHLISLMALPPSPNIEPSRLSFSDHPYSLKAIPVLDR
jgi:hypothetical protein